MAERCKRCGGRRMLPPENGFNASVCPACDGTGVNLATCNGGVVEETMKNCGTCIWWKKLVDTDDSWGGCRWENAHTKPARAILPEWLTIPPASMRGSRSKVHGANCEAHHG